MMPPSAAIAGLLLAVVLGSGIVIRLRLRRPYFIINPSYLELFEDTGLTTSRALLAMPAVIVSGHPDRNVAQVHLGYGDNILRAFLKREHSVRLKERLFNALAGFGFVSKSHREALALDRIKRAGIRCGDWIAFGQATDGSAFLLVEAIDNRGDLRGFLEKGLTCPRGRRGFACELGMRLAGIHNAGFDQPDFYAKHVLIDERAGGLCFLDWQRSRQFRLVSWPKRYRDLAALHATLPAEATTVRERIACLRAYLRATRTWEHQVASNRATATVPDLVFAAQEINRRAERLMNRRHIRQSRHISSASSSQNVIWLNGEALCVTPAYLEQSQGRVPDFLAIPQTSAASLENLERNQITLAEDRLANLVRRRAFRPLSLTVCRLLGKKWSAPEVRQAGLIFRLQRHGIDTPRLLAFGQRHRFPWRVESFLLTETIQNATSLNQSLANRSSSEGGDRFAIHQRLLIRSAGTVLRRVHAAGCRFRGTIKDGLDLVTVSQSEMSVALGRIDNLVVQRGNGLTHLSRDLIGLRRSLAPIMTSRTDAVRLVRAYLDLARLDEHGKRLCRQLLAEPLSQLHRPFARPAPDDILATSALRTPRVGWRPSS
jgi:hypothetical protein